MQPATLNLKAVSPKRFIIFVLGAGVAGFLSLGLAYARDALDTTIRTRDDLASHVDVPELVTLPRTVAKQVITRT